MSRLSAVLKDKSQQCQNEHAKAIRSLESSFLIDITSILLENFGNATP